MTCGIPHVADVCVSREIVRSRSPGRTAYKTHRLYCIWVTVARAYLNSDCSTQSVSLIRNISVRPSTESDICLYSKAVSERNICDIRTRGELQPALSVRRPPNRHTISTVSCCPYPADVWESGIVLSNLLNKLLGLR